MQFRWFNSHPFNTYKSVLGFWNMIITDWVSKSFYESLGWHAGTASHLQFLRCSIMSSPAWFIWSSGLKIPLSSLTPFFLENKIDSFADFFSYFLLWFGIFHDNELEGSEKFYRSMPCTLKLGFALYNALVSRSEILCYFVSSWFHSET